MMEKPSSNQNENSNNQQAQSSPSQLPKRIKKKCGCGKKRNKA
jgi:hypothetical protein